MKKKTILIRLTSRALLGMLVMLSIVLPPLTCGERAALHALEQLEIPYVFGQAGPKSYDCSGLVKASYHAYGVHLPHNAEQLGYSQRYRTLKRPMEFCVGDLVFFDTVNDRDECDHVGIWLGGNQFVHASSSKGRVVVSNFDENWQKAFSWGKRVVCPFF